MYSCFTWYRWHQGLPSPLLLLPPFLAATRSPAISSPGSTLRPGVTWYSATSSKLPLPMLLACPVQLVRETLSEQPPPTSSFSSNPAPSIWLGDQQVTKAHLNHTPEDLQDQPEPEQVPGWKLLAQRPSQGRRSPGIQSASI